MSDSRLEKFIYAICSMDVSDLPVPLSRIETLWNCLITGETPDFEPISRNEKYLMSMLDRYDISNLPAPMSRGEQLLYKIAVGETDLSDVPGYLSRYEELLKYLIENGENSEDDFEYVLYTLNQSLHTLYLTAEKPVKSAILKGNTLVNISSLNGEITIAPGSVQYIDSPFIKKDTTFTVSFNCSSVPTTEFIEFRQIFENTALKMENKPVVQGYNRFKLTTVSSEIKRFRLKNDSTSETDFIFNNLMILEGDYTNVDIPYFEGMKSVQMPVLKTIGKNLFDGNQPPEQLSWGNNVKKANVKENTTYVYSSSPYTGYVSFKFYDNNDNQIRQDISITSGTSFTTPPNTSYLKTHTANDSLVQIEEGTQATPYEPYKSNILTVNEEVELRGIGDVQDTLDCLTGEVTESIGEIVLDGTQYMDADGRGIYIQVDDMKKVEDYRAIITCDKLPVFYHQWDLPNVENGIAGYLDEENKYPGQNWLYIKVNNSIDVGEVRQNLTQNPITVQYQLATESVKTVDLSVVDQDNQPTELGTFENITHVSLEAENLIPEVEMEVATNLLEDTIFNLTNAFNTLYPTAAKPIKSAILKGQTLVNVHPTDYVVAGSNPTFFLSKNIPKTMIKPNTRYFLRLYNTHQSIVRAYFKPCANNTVNLISSDNKCAIFTTKSEFGDSDFNNNKIHFYSSSELALEDIKDTKVILCEYVDGMENWDIPYFTGMQSVKMPVLKTTGKNLFDMNIMGTSETRDGWTYERTENLIHFTSDGTKAYQQYSLDITNHLANEIKLGKPYSFTSDISKNITNDALSICQLMITNKDGSKHYYDTPRVFTLNKEFSKIEIRIIGHNHNEVGIPSDYTIKNIQLEEGSVATSCEPYKTNILTVNEDVTLRAIGDVKDELNVVTGELTQRIGEVVLDGSEDWKNQDDSKWNNDTHISFRFKLNNMAYNRWNSRTINCISDKFTTKPLNNNSYILDEEFIGSDGLAIGDMNFNIKLLRSRLNGDETLDGFKEWLSQNPFTLQYQLANESVKTVDLTVVDQDNQPTELGTFDNTTHVLLNSEGLIPTAVLTVRTKIPSASSTSLLMDDISTNQQQLETTVDEQSNNVDATMVATTEIFEDTL